MNEENNYIVEGLIHQEDIIQIKVHKSKLDTITRRIFCQADKILEIQTIWII